jgi:hypothetical protein
VNSGILFDVLQEHLGKKLGKLLAEVISRSSSAEDDLSIRVEDGRPGASLRAG